MSPAIVIPLTVVGTGTAALLGYLLYERLKAPASGGSLAVPSALQRGQPGGGGGGGYAPPSGSSASDDVPMSARVRPHLDNLLRNGKDPAAFEIVAQTLEGLGYTGEAAEVRAREQQLKSGAPQIQNQTDPTPQQPAARPADPTRATVTTRDPAPSGDLAIYASPGGALVGGAEKDHVVTILQWDVDGTGQWARVQWVGGTRRGPASGYAHRAFLVPVDVYAGVRHGSVGNLRNPTRPAGRDAKFERYMARKAAFGAAASGEVHARDGKVRWPGGLRLRAEPQQNARTMALVPAASSVHVLRQVAGPKLEPSAPGPGGWSEIGWMGRRGWVPSEWVA